MPNFEGKKEKEKKCFHPKQGIVGHNFILFIFYGKFTH